jgi:acetyl/propionyl-CoA carboxylase alpha subunit/acetyl-CoA carboxylase carboxyltransferase component
VKLLVANRGEVAVRILRAAAEVGLPAVAVAPADDAGRHLPMADEQVTLPGTGASAYLDVERLVQVAVAAGCGLVHPGYGFLSERAAFAEACATAGLGFVGPAPDVLALTGDKVRSREVAAAAGLTVVDGTGPVRSVAQIEAFLDTLGGAPAMLKATAGGGGRGTRRVAAGDDLAAALERCRSEAERAFGDPTVHLERLLPDVRHVEVQLLGDGTDLVALGDRDCSLQRGRQKLVEVAPAPGLSAAARTAIADDAVAFGRSAGVASLATVEFLVSRTGRERTFLECNPRLQVEHAVTEAVTGVDLVAAQLRVALGARLGDLDLRTPPSTRGTAVEVRVNAETVDVDGVRPDAGQVTRFEVPTGPHRRVETAAHPGYVVDPRFDALLAKLVVDGPDLATALARAERALGEFHIEGVDTGAEVLRAALGRPELADWSVDTTWFEDHLAELVGAVERRGPGRAPDAAVPGEEAAASDAPGAPDALGAEEVADAVRAPSRATVVAVRVTEGDVVRAGQELLVLEAMKMQRSVAAPHGGTVGAVLAEVGHVVATGAPLLVLPPDGSDVEDVAAAAEVDPDHVRDDLRRLHEAIAPTLDEHRPDAVARRRSRGRRTARENLADLVDDGSFLEYGQLAVAGQRRARSLDDLIVATPADGIVTGTASIGAAQVGSAASRVAVLAYDYTVLAGTQGLVGHHKTDRILELAHEQRLPVVFFTEGGGGRPGDVDHLDVSFSGLDLDTFATFAAIGTVAPRVAVNAGYGFAGNALLFGCADVRIATRDSSLGLAGPVMIEAAGLGACSPGEVGPAERLADLGVVDVLAEDEPHATALARMAIEHLRGDRIAGEGPDQRRLRHVVPEDRKRAYGVRDVVALLADEGSVLELGATHAPGMVTAHVRIDGRPWGLIGNDPLHLGGAIDAAGAAKAARFLRHCERFRLPVVSLCDTPGFMVGPDSEREGAAGAAAAMVEAGATLTVPLVLVCLRKGYGIGAMAMAGGSFRRPAATLSWPGGEFGPMSLEGIARIVSKAELEAEPDPAVRAALLAERTAGLQQLGGAVAVARLLEIDAVIDPADTRRWLTGTLPARPASPDAVT